MFLIDDKIINKYPRVNLEESIVGLKSAIYKIVDRYPEYNPEIQDIEKSDIEKTIELYKGLSHIFIAYQNYKVVDLPTQHIINKLNEGLGNYLDSVYPLWERAKHAGEGNYINWDKDNLTQEQIDKKAYIDSIYAWITRCRQERDLREKEFLINGTIPDFYNWEPRP